MKQGIRVDSYCSSWILFLLLKKGMSIDAIKLKELVASELGKTRDDRVLDQIRKHSIEPEAQFRDWDYGDPGEKFICWDVLRDNSSKTGIAYCESGFGPRCPWGLVGIGKGTGPSLSIGMDSSWFPSLLDAFFDSSLASELAIWRVYKETNDHNGEFLTNEGLWDDTWARVYELRENEPTSRIHCRHSITFKSGFSEG